MRQFKILNSIFGWITFAIAAMVYLSTIEPTVSFWDCGEFIATAFKLQVNHPPGNSFFELMGHFFTMFAGNHLEKVPVAMNVMSSLVSAFTILLLFWSITHMARKIIIKNNEYTLGNTLAIIGSGLVGALAFTFSDSFWFSAVEGIVWSTSSLFTAIVFWAILKWEEHADEKHANRWLIFLAYIVGLSIGVHLLNLLAIPAIVFIYYFKKYQFSVKGIISAAIITSVIIGAIMFGFVRGLIYGAAYMDLLFVNGFGLHYYSGVIFYLVAIIAFLVWGLHFTYKNRKVLLNTILLVFTVLLLGYSSVTLIVIRSMANTPLNENDPENMFSLLYYLSREQYGDRPLIYGPVYNAPLDRENPYNVDGKPTVTPINGKYDITYPKVTYNYDDRFMMLFPRMFSPDADHVKAYKWWANIKGEPIDAADNRGEPTTIYKPTFAENLKFFFKYQVYHMYIRYFMWNFAGRQNDLQGHGEITKGNWLTGIKFFDEWRLGPQDKLPESMAKNKGLHKYYMFPFILGLIGLIYHYRREKKDFTVLALFFFFTGLAIVLYLNQTPYQPRERDYSYVASFYVFAMWLGLGVLCLYDIILKKINSPAKAILITLLCLGLVPTIMAKENWADHDRSYRYTARDFAYDYLMSCEKNAIIFTNGDNDTFPLWYCQEVENIRTDVRIVNLSYLSADWYIDQMEKKQYESDPVPFSFKRLQVLQGKRDIVFLTDKIKDYVDIKDAINFVASDDPATKIQTSYSNQTDYIPSKNLKIVVDTAELFNSGYLSRDLAKMVVPQMKWTINRNYITKSDLMILDLLANNNWKRPIYFAITVARENYLSLDNYMQICGLTYKIVPIKSEVNRGEIMNIDTKIVFDNYMHKFKWGGINNPKVYLDENNMRMLSNFRNGFSKLAEALIKEGKRDSALTVLDKCLEVLPDNCVPYNFFMTNIIDLYYRLNRPDKANAIAIRLGDLMDGELNYLFRLKPEDREFIDYDVQIALYSVQQLAVKTKMYGHLDLARKYEELLTKYSNLYRPNN
jgi:hypothetical protein